MNYILETKVLKIEQRERRFNIRKTEGDVVMSDSEDLGWFVQFDGSRESLYLGHEQPEMVVGQKVTIRIEPQ